MLVCNASVFNASVTSAVVLLFTGSIFHRQVKEERQVQAKELEAEKDRVDELLEEKAKLEHDRQVHATELEAKVEEQGKVIERLEETIADLSWR